MQVKCLINRRAWTSSGLIELSVLWAVQTYMEAVHTLDLSTLREDDAPYVLCIMEDGANDMKALALIMLMTLTSMAYASSNFIVRLAREIPSYQWHENLSLSTELKENSGTYQVALGIGQDSIALVRCEKRCRLLN